MVEPPLGLGIKHPFMIEHVLCPEHIAVNEIDQIPYCRGTQRDFGKEVVLGRLTEHLERAGGASLRSSEI